MAAIWIEIKKVPNWDFFFVSYLILFAQLLNLVATNQTFYEKIYLAEGIPINYAQYSLNKAFLSNHLDRLPEEAS